MAMAMAMAQVSKRTVDGMEAPAEGKQSWLWDDQVRGLNAHWFLSMADARTKIEA